MEITVMTDFSRYLHKFLTQYLPGERGASSNTIDTYRYTFILFLEFVKSEKNIKPDKYRIELFTRNVVIEFLEWIEKKQELFNLNKKQSSSMFIIIRSLLII